MEKNDGTPEKGVTQLLLFTVLYAEGRKLNYQRAPEQSS